MENPEPVRERTNLRTTIVVVVLAAAGIALLAIAANNDWIIAHPSIQSVIRDIGSLLLATGAISTVWELAAKRAFLTELMAMARLAEDVRAAGLVGLTTRFLRDVPWSELLRNARHVDAFFAYASTWRGVYTPELRSLAARRGSRVRIALPDANNDSVMHNLAMRFGEPVDDVRRKIATAVADLREIFRDADRHNVEFSLYYVSVTPLLSFYRFDNTAVVAVYRHRKGRAEVPTLVVRSGGSLYEFVREELETVFESGAIVTPAPQAR
jgi:hypothetical protein